MRRRKTVARKGKHNRSTECFEKGNVLRFDLKGVQKGFGQRGRGRSFHVEGPETEKVWEPAVDSLVQRICRLRISEAERRVHEVCKVEVSHRDKTEQCAQ